MFFWEEHQLWTFTRQADVSAIFRDRRFGRQISQLRSPQELGQATVPEHLQPFFDIDRLSMIGLEPPAHTRLRSLVQKAFVGKQIEALRPRIQPLCDHLIDQMADGPLATMGFYETDLIASYATPIQVIVIAEILGVPTDMTPKLLDWSHSMVQMYEMKRTAEMELAAVQASKEFVAYMRSLGLGADDDQRSSI